jgi:hypothetical protein
VVWVASVSRGVVRVMLALMLVVSVVVPVGSAAESEPVLVLRLAGADRFGTSVVVSQEMYPFGASRVYVATGYDFPDALAAGGGLPGPVLLTRPDVVPGDVLAEIQRLGPVRVFVVGGSAVVSDAVVTQLAAAGSWSVSRLWGADRFGTSVAVSRATYPSQEYWYGADRAYVATGYDFPDALVAGGELPGPVLLTRPDVVPGDVLAEILRIGPSEVFVIGGTAVISDSVVTQIQKVLDPRADDPVQRAALVALYEATDGDNWDYSAGWLSTTSYCTWHGITCGTGHDVEDLSLFFNEMSGSIPAELGNLANLQTLNLFSNGLSGPIPTELRNLANLEYLRLSDNGLSGPIPAELGNLANLWSLDLGSNGLSGQVPPELMNLTNLTELYVRGQSGCLTATDSGLVSWLVSYDPQWNDGCP